jgi:hypothetical protein
MLVLIPVIYENNLYVDFLCLFFPFAQWTQWGTVMIHRLFSHSVYSLKSDRSRDVVWRSVQFFLAYYFDVFPVQTSGWIERFKQVHRHYLILDWEQFPFNFILNFSFGNLTFTYILLCSGTDNKQTTQTRIPLIRQKCESVSDKLRATLYNFTVTCSSHIKWISGFILRTLYLSDHCASVACNKQKVSGSQL